MLDLLGFCDEKEIRFPVMILFRRWRDICVFEYEQEHEHESRLRDLH